jgi:translocation and assembly module TamA
VRSFVALLAACASSSLLAAEPPADRPASSGTAAQAPAKDGRADRPLEVTWQAPQPLRGLYEKYLPPPKEVPAGEDRAVAVRGWVRDVRRRVPEIAASEGYFSPILDIRFDEERRHATVTVNPGPRTDVEKVDIEFTGDLAGEGEEREARRRQLRDAWTLKAGAPFRSPAWETAKASLEESLTDEDYAAGSISRSEARVDAEAARATLTIVLDSGPRFTLGDVRIDGLHHYPESVIRRVVDLRRDERYSRARLEELRRLVQTGPWFSSVVVDVERDPAHALLAPVMMNVVERPRREVGLAIGYGTDDGARIETSFRDRDLFDRGFDLQSSIRAAQEDQFGYVDIYMPPGLFRRSGGATIPFTDSFGVLTEHSTVQKLVFSRFGVAGSRHFKLDEVETRVGLSYQIERDYPQGSDPRITRALAPIVSITWRHVDNLYDPHRGGVLNTQVATGSRSLASGENFFKAYAQYQYWFPLGDRDQLLLRGELGRNFTPSRASLPEDFLFRAGGARSNRGYAYQSLGVREGDAVAGGRYIATGTVEYVHWLNEQWGAAVFTDVGDAADTAAELHANPSYGVGARFKTPAGPLGLDLAYADREHRFRLSFSVTVAF